MTTQSSDQPKLLGERAWSIQFQRSARRSTYTLAAGGHSEVYYDMIEFLLGHRDNEEYYPDEGARRQAQFVETMKLKLKPLVLKYGISRLAFIEPAGARATGIVPAMTQISDAVGVSACLVRPRKRLIREQIKGAPILPCENIILVTDVATSGSTMNEAAECLRTHGARVDHAFVVFDREDGAADCLSAAGITLHAADSKSNYLQFCAEEIDPAAAAH